MILLASIFYVIGNSKESALSAKQTRGVTHGLKLANVSLAVFLIALIFAGIGKGVLYTGEPYQVIMYNIRPFLLTFSIAGIALMIGIWAILWTAYRGLGSKLESNKRIETNSEILEVN